MTKNKLWEQVNEKLKELGIKVNMRNSPPYKGDVVGQIHKYIKCYDNKIISFFAKDKNNIPYRCFKKISKPIYGCWYWTGEEWTRDRLKGDNWNLQAQSVDEFIKKGGKVKFYKGKKI